MPENTVHMDALELRQTAKRITRLNLLVKEAKLLNEPHSEELAELDDLNWRLASHPIRGRVTFASSRLLLVTHDQEFYERTGYWYKITHNQIWAVAAFRQRSALMCWLSERGLNLSSSLPDEGTVSYQNLDGGFREVTHCSYDVFYSLIGFRTRVWSNGSFTMAIITDDQDGLKTVHTLHPSCGDRPIYNYAERT